jgi:hypothetical protein
MCYSYWLSRVHGAMGCRDNAGERIATVKVEVISLVAFVLATKNRCLAAGEEGRVLWDVSGA